jgi:Mg/Co/Ni transporter MgtE
MPKIYSDHLFDLEKNDVTEEINSNSLEEVDDEDYSDNVALLLEEIKSKVKKPSLDFLLEKIKSKGINSLSQFEKDTLNEYSKN